jgi:hypothetical protein
MKQAIRQNNVAVEGISDDSEGCNYSSSMEMDGLDVDSEFCNQVPQ